MTETTRQLIGHIYRPLYQLNDQLHTLEQLARIADGYAEEMALIDMDNLVDIEKNDLRSCVALLRAMCAVLSESHYPALKAVVDEAYHATEDKT